MKAARLDWANAPDAPATLDTPWATLLHRGDDDLYYEAESGRRASLAGWRDRILRHHEWGRPLWRRSAAGVAHIPDGEAFAFLWPQLDLWSAGYGSSHGEFVGGWLLRSVRWDLARRSCEEWVSARRAAVELDVDARLGLTR